MGWISAHNTVLKTLLEEGRPSLPRPKEVKTGSEFHTPSKGTRQRVKKKIREYGLCNEIFAELEALMVWGKIRYPLS